MKCKNCGHEFSAKFCPECGMAASFGSDKIKCRKCGNDVDNKLKYCPECGESTGRSYKDEDKDKRDRRGRDRGDDGDDEGGVLGSIGDIIGGLFRK